MKMWNNFLLSGLILLLVSSCTDPVKTRHLVYFVDDDFWGNNESVDLFWEKIALKIEQAGKDSDVKTIELTIYSIEANGPQIKVSRVIDSENEPAMKDRPIGFSSEYVEDLKSRCCSSNNKNGIVHIAPTLALIRSVWRKCQRDTNRQIEIIYISNMCEQTDGLISLDGRYNFLLKSPLMINRSGVDDAIQDIQNQQSLFCKQYILPNKNDYGELKIVICKLDRGGSPGFDRIESYWLKCFEQIGIEEENIYFNDSIIF